MAKQDPNPQRKIILISTGGTIEKTYDETHGGLDNRASIIMQKIVDNLRLPYIDLEVEVIMAKDSLYMTEEDRVFIAETIFDRLEENSPIVVLHGTDTMAETANVCFESIKAPKVPIVFTGAMRPLEFKNTDAIQNVTEAMMAAQIAPPGVYISFHSRLFTLPNVTKNRDTLTFEAT